MNRDKELFKLARQHSMLIDLFRKDRIDEEWFLKEIKKIEHKISEDRYDVDKFVEYKKLYKKMTIEECKEFVRGLEQTGGYIMNDNTELPATYIRKNREEEVMILLKENDRKAAQRFLCHMCAVKKKYIILGETTNIEDIKDCDIVLVASASVLSRDQKEYVKIENKLKKNGIKIEVVGSDGDIGDYLDMMIKFSRKGRI